MSSPHPIQRGRIPRVRSVRVTEVVEVVAAEGTGEGPDSVVREVLYLYRTDGELIARVDPYPEATT